MGADLLVNDITQKITYVDNKMLKHDESVVTDALAKLLPLVDLSEATFGQDYRLVPVIDNFTFEPSIVAELTYNGMCEYLYAHNVLSNLEFFPVFEGDHFERDVASGEFAVTRAHQSKVITQACIKLTLPNNETAMTCMSLKELAECESISRKKLYGGQWPFETMYEFYAQCLLRRALNEHDILLESEYIGDVYEITKPLVALHVDYVKRYDAMEAHYNAESIVLKKSFAVSKQPSKSVAFLDQLDSKPETDNVVELKPVSDDNHEEFVSGMANDW